MDVRKAVPGEKNYEQPGYFIVDDIITFRCSFCFQHMSLFKYDVDSAGKVNPDIQCENCKTTHPDVVLTAFDSTKKKKKDNLKVKDKSLVNIELGISIGTP